MHTERRHTPREEPLWRLYYDRRQTPREEPLWRLYRQGHEASCDLLIGRCGFEARFLMNGRFLSSHLFSLPHEAMAWAGQKETQYRLHGWTPAI
jgi:hypothetical protein